MQIYIHISIETPAPANGNKPIKESYWKKRNLKKCQRYRNETLNWQWVEMYIYIDWDWRKKSVKDEWTNE